MQKRTDLNLKIAQLLTSGVTIRESARILKCNYKTVYLKFKWLGERAKLIHSMQNLKAESIYFDELQSIEHTKLKPLTVALVVNQDYQLLGVKVSSIPCKGKRREQKYLAKEKYIFDPLFQVNHMCARLRDHIKRLTRRSWCTSKLAHHLELNIFLYIAIKQNYKIA